MSVTKPPSRDPSVPHPGRTFYGGRWCTDEEIDRIRTDARAYSARESSTRRSWRQMKDRCVNPNCPDWEYYGGRGITVCERWRDSFEDFLADMGERPEGTTLDRIDVNGDYEPGNCRWATAKEQRANRRTKKK